MTHPRPSSGLRQFIPEWMQIYTHRHSHTQTHLSPHSAPWHTSTKKQIRMNNRLVLQFLILVIAVTTVAISVNIPSLSGTLTHQCPPQQALTSLCVWKVKVSTNKSTMLEGWRLCRKQIPMALFAGLYHMAPPKIGLSSVKPSPQVRLLSL